VNSVASAPPRLCPVTKMSGTSEPVYAHMRSWLQLDQGHRPSGPLIHRAAATATVHLRHGRSTLPFRSAHFHGRQQRDERILPSQDGTWLCSGTVTIAARGAPASATSLCSSLAITSYAPPSNPPSCWYAKRPVPSACPVPGPPARQFRIICRVD
jgi:hypothetical protein